MSDLTERRSRLRQFCQDTGLPREAVETFVAAQSRRVNEMRRQGNVTCDLTLDYANGVTLIDCVYHSSNGETHPIRVAASGSNALGLPTASMGTPVLAMRLAGLLLADLDMQARLRGPAGAITSVCNRDAKHAQPLAYLAPDLVTDVEVLDWIGRQAAFIRTKMARTQVTCHLTVYDGSDGPQMEAWFACDDGDVGIVSLHCSGVTCLGDDGGDFASLTVAVAVAGRLLEELDMSASISS